MGGILYKNKIKKGMSMDFTDVLYDDPDAPIKVVDEFCEKKMQKEVDEIRAKAKALHARLQEESYQKILTMLNKGWSIRQPASEEIGKCNVMEYFRAKKGWLSEKVETDSLCQGECQAVLNTGKFENYKREDFIIWKKKE
jgi:galactokinase/mevalonate kinase-like predicted kinase